jgi:hypothetical protein
VFWDGTPWSLVREVEGFEGSWCSQAFQGDGLLMLQLDPLKQLGLFSDHYSIA